MRKAVIDVGSNSLILVIEERHSDGWQTVLERTAVTSLGEGTKTTKLLGERGMNASLEALRTFYTLAAQHGAESIEAGATMAVRIADNKQEFLDLAEGQGTPVFILSGEDEAQLGFESVANDPTFAGHDRLTIVDPGGQSTELMTAVRDGDGWAMKFKKSFPIGTLGLRSTILMDEAPAPPAILTASTFIDDTIGMKYARDESGLTIVLGATGTNLVSIRERLTTWEPEKVHGEWLSYGEIGQSVGYMMQMTDAERAGIIGIEPGREKTLHIGALIVERFLNAILAPGCAVSVRGWRHALLERGLPDVGKVN